MVKSLKLLFITSLILTFSGCGNNMEFDKILGAKTEAYAESACKDNYGYYTSAQILKLDIVFNGYVDKVEIICYDGLIKTYDAEYISEKNSQRVAELLREPRYSR